jgi:hypothetical protein
VGLRRLCHIGIGLGTFGLLRYGLLGLSTQLGFIVRCFGGRPPLLARDDLSNPLRTAVGPTTG